jgi:CspA family cold shock protein
MARMTGVVKWFNENKGYGFIRQDSDGRDVYVHYKDIEGEGFRTLSEGDRVEYDAVGSAEGVRAAGVRRFE